MQNITTEKKKKNDHYLQMVPLYNWKKVKTSQMNNTQNGSIWIEGQACN